MAIGTSISRMRRLHKAMLGVVCLLGIATYTAVPVVHYLSLSPPPSASRAPSGTDRSDPAPTPHDPSTCPIHNAYLNQLAGCDVPVADLPETPVYDAPDVTPCADGPAYSAPDLRAISPRGPPATSPIA